MTDPAAPLKTFYRSLMGEGAMPLPHDHEYYVPMFEGDPGRDPILRLTQRIDLAESESVNLLTGFRGNGKSTQLRRLKFLLEQRGCRVFLVDMKNYILLTKPLEISDFILSICAALAAEAERDQGLRPLAEGYGERLLNFLQSRVELKDLSLEWKGPEASAKLGASLKTDPTFKQRVQEALRGHVTALIEQARGFVIDIVETIRRQESDPDKKVVLLVDSVEQIRGVGAEAAQVYDSVINLFAAHAANLEFRQLHCLYTLPPFLVHNAGRNLGGHAVTQWPNIHVCDKAGECDDKGLGIMRTIIERRYADWASVISRTLLDDLALASGGDLRDYFRLVREALISVITVSEAGGGGPPDVTVEMIEQVKNQLRSDLLPIAREDGRWLQIIHRTKQTALEREAEVHRLTRFLDANFIMNYLNGEPWYDIHPLLRDEVAQYQAE
jgi:hypothetical protein